MGKRYVVFILSLFTNALGIAITIKGGVGATVWAAAYDNFSNMLNITSGQGALIVSFCVFVLSKIIAKDLNFKNAVGCLIASVSSSFIIDMWLNIIGKNQLSNMYLNILLAIVGCLVTILGVSLAIKSNTIFLALDDFLKNIKIHICKGNVAVASTMANVFALVIAIVCGLIDGHIVNIAPITIIMVLTFGPILSVVDKIVKINFKDTPVKSSKENDDENDKVDLKDVVLENK